MGPLIIQGIFQCCISIALIYEDEIVLGVINDFNQNALYEGTINSSAKSNGLEINVSSIDNQSNATLATVPPQKVNLMKIL